MKLFGFEIRKPGKDDRDNEWRVLFDAVSTIIEKENRIMTKLEDLKADAQLAIAKIDNLNTALDGVRVAMDAIKSELENLKNAGLTDAQKAIVDETHAMLITAVQKIDETLAENVPATEPGGGDVV